MASIQDGNGGGLVQFLDWASTKGVMKKATAQSYRAAVVKVLEIDGDGWESTDVRKIDVDSQLDRFATLSGHNYTPQSLTTYRGRFQKAVAMYLDYLSSPSTFKAPVQTRQRTGSAKEGSNGSSSAADVPAPTPPIHTATDELIEYAFPLKSGATAYLRLPRQFSSDEVNRLTNFLAALAIDPPKALPRGDGRQLASSAG